MRKNDIILTGMPRTGTTLTCNILNHQPNVVALHEPIVPKKQGEHLSDISHFFDETRKSALQTGRVISKNINGEVPDNTYGNQRNELGLRVNIKGKQRSAISIDKKLTNHFTLCVKQVGFFAALLDELMDEFNCYAIVRNPVATLLSWNSVQMPVNNGHIPAAENCDARLKQSLSKIDNVLDRQIFIMEWFFNQFRPLLEQGRCIFYEETVSSNGANLSQITGSEIQASENLSSKNNNPIYDHSLKKTIIEKLAHPNCTVWRDYYSLEEIQNS